MKLEKFLFEYHGEDRIVSSQELKDHLKEAQNRKALVYIKSGIPSLDNLIGGFEGGELNVISGISGQGKTLLYF